jgi:hypothetical protein
MLPKQMHFSAVPGGAFQAMSDPRQRDAIVQVASNTTAGQPLAFSLSGTGTLAERKDKNEGSAQSTNTLRSGKTVQESGARMQARPPAASSNRSGKVRWYLLGGLGVLLAMVTILLAGRSNKWRVSHSVRPDVKGSVAVRRVMSERISGSKLILNDLKEQLFLLEVKHKENRISQEEYEKAIATFRQHLEWAMARKAAMPMPGHVACPEPERNYPPRHNLRR